jgi:hypothetical protein
MGFRKDPRILGAVAGGLKGLGGKDGRWCADSGGI